jgi:alanine racemase
VDAPLALWAEIDLAAVAHNISELKRATAPGVRFMAVVKANAYGHGDVAVARHALAAGADALGVARIGEGVALRSAGIRAPILIFGYTPPNLAEALIEHDLTATLYTIGAAQALSDIAVARRSTIRAHLKVDTGMGRLGIVPDSRCFSGGHRMDVADAVQQVAAMRRMPGLDFEGIYTHFATADTADKTAARTQFHRFKTFLDALAAAGIVFPIRHAANSAATIELPETHLDMVRAGISIYGLYPSGEVARSRAQLVPVMTLKAVIAHLKSVPAGFAVSYGSTWKASRPTKIATIPIGYADGYSRLLSNRGQMIVGGRRAPVVGRVCMDQTMLDVGHIPGVQPGDVVTIIGGRDDTVITADEIAAELGTIHYEVTSSIMARVPRRLIGTPTSGSMPQGTRRLTVDP